MNLRITPLTATERTSMLQLNSLRQAGLSLMCTACHAAPNELRFSRVCGDSRACRVAPGYSREQFEEDLVSECEKDIRQAFAAGAARVSVDFTEGRLATRNDPRNPWTGRNMLPHFIELNNRVMDRFSAEERTRIGLHTCPGGDRDSVHSADVPYSDLLPSMFGINAGYFLSQLASERDKDRVYRLIGENLRGDANGVTQMAYVGVINPLNPRVESPEEVRDALVRAASFIPVSYTHLTLPTKALV